MEISGKNGRLQLQGQYGKWKIIKITDNKKHGNILWLCECACGTIREVMASNLRSGASLSCGCHRREINSIVQKTHGMSRVKNPLYSIWKGIRVRCLNPKNPAYKYYGGRGIKICDRWLEDFTNFYNDMYSTYKEGLTLDRINNDGDYEPWNCEWSTREKQAKNRSTNFYIETEIHGKLTITDAAKIVGVTVYGMRYRIENWPKYRWFEVPR